jgi:hypothetical protein
MIENLYCDSSTKLLTRYITKVVKTVRQETVEIEEHNIGELI